MADVRLSRSLFALAMIEEEMLAPKGLGTSRLRETIEEVLLAEPKYRQNYYPGDEATRAYKRKYSFSDRSCCYWPNPQITAA